MSTATATKQKATNLPEGVTHLHGDLYRVRHDLIEYADDGFDLGSDELIFQNPRHITASTDSKPMGLGFSKPEMDELRESIRTQGLKSPLSTRWMPGNQKVQIVDGERRKRSIDKLRKDKSDVYVPATGKQAPAGEHYEYIDCRIEEMDEEAALKHSISMTQSGRSFGEGALVVIVRHLRKCGKDDKEILEIMGKSPSWLKQSDDILQLDDKSFTAFCDDKINRTVALQLVTIPDVAKRIKLLGHASKIAQQRITEEMKKLDDQVEKAETELEHAEGEEAEANAIGTPDKKKKATRKVRVARTKVETKKKAKEEATKKGTAKVIDKDLQQAAKETETEDVKPKALTGVKIQKHYVDVLVSTIRRGGKDEEGNDLDFDPEELQLAKTVCDFIVKGEPDVFKALKQHRTNKARRAKTKPAAKKKSAPKRAAKKPTAKKSAPRKRTTKKAK